jgi:hypothetical protein
MLAEKRRSELDDPGGFVKRGGSMRLPLVVLAVAVLAGCGASAATGRLPARLLRNTAQAVPARPVVLRSADGTQFSETEVAVEMDAVPGPVRALRNAACPNREGGVRFARLEVDGAEAFKVYAGQTLRACAVVARPNGVRIRVEEAMDPTALPAPVVAAIEGVFHGDYTIAEVWTIREDGGDETVEALVRKFGRELVLVMTSTGTVRQRLRRLPAILDVPDR